MYTITEQYHVVALRLFLSFIYRVPQALRACPQAIGAEVEDTVGGGPLEGK